MSLGRLLLAALVALAAPAAVAAPSERLPDAAAGQRQILVMLKLAPPHLRPHGGYGGSYGDAQAQAARRRIAQAIARNNGLAVDDSWAMPLLGIDCFVMTVPATMSVADAVARVSRDPRVEWSQPQQQFVSRSASDDPLFAAEPAASRWKLAELHRVATGRGVEVAIIDSRIDVRHPDLAGQFVADRDFVDDRSSRPERHGTGVAGIIAAKANNGIGIAGVAPNARLMALRACWQEGAASPTTCNSLSLGRALHFAIDKGADVINLSLSGPHDRLLEKLIGIAVQRRATVVAAFDPRLPGGGFPASQPGVIAVVDESLQSRPSWLYAAPGSNVPTTQPGGRWYLVNGNSFAAAHVSALAALVRDRRRPASGSVAISRGADGRVDACATLLGPRHGCDSVQSAAAKR